MRLGEGNDLADARRHEDALPEPLLACTERAADLGVQFAHVDTVAVEIVKDLRVAFFEQRYHQVLGTDVILIVVAALLLGGAEHAPRCRAKLSEQRYPFNATSSETLRGSRPRRKPQARLSGR